MNHTVMRMLIANAPKHVALQQRLKTLYDTLSLELTAMQGVLREAHEAKLPELALDDLAEGLAELTQRRDRLNLVLQQVRIRHEAATAVTP
jgi:hypothetical protein